MVFCHPASDDGVNLFSLLRNSPMHLVNSESCDRGEFLLFSLNPQPDLSYF